MSIPTLTEQIDGILWSDEGAAMFTQLSSFSAADEAGAAVVTAAAFILAKESPNPTSAGDARLARLTAEFSDLVFTIREQFLASPGARRSQVRVVGGLDG